MAITVGMISLGCPKNEVDAEIMLADLQKEGFELVGDAALAEVVIINTCGFIESAKKESIEQILEMGLLKKEGRIKRIVVTGCLAERYKEELAEEIPEADIILGIGSNSELCSAIKRSMQDDKQILSFNDKTCLTLEGDRVLTTLPFYAYLKIAEGCDNNCTYCAIPKIRGRFRSREIESIISEAKSLAKAGIEEIILVAQDTTRYGTDLYGKPSLSKLLYELDKIEGIRWIRILYAYPEVIDDELIEAIKSIDKVVKYIDIPIQHSNREILKKMNRKGDGKSILALINKLRENIPDIVLRSTVITGFPSETEEQFLELCEFLKKAKFERLGCFPYSCEEGTPAAKIKPQVSAEIAEERADIIMRSQMRISDEYNRSRIGKTMGVFVEGFDKYGECYFGRTAYDAPEIDGKVFFSSNRPLRIGDFVMVEIQEALDYDLMGIALDMEEI